MSHQFLATEDLPTASVDELTKDINEAEKLLAVHPDHFTSYEAAQEDEAYRRDVQGHLERVQWTLSQR
jgi:hypothetical protein